MNIKKKTKKKLSYSFQMTSIWILLYFLIITEDVLLCCGLWLGPSYSEKATK